MEEDCGRASALGRGGHGRPSGFRRLAAGRGAGDWWYSYSDGSYPSDGFAEIDGSWYLFDESGYMLTGWQQVGSTWYYLDENGVMQTGWLQLPDGWYFLNGGGAMQTGWLQNGGCWYYLDGGGRDGHRLAAGRLHLVLYGRKRPYGDR